MRFGHAGLNCTLFEMVGTILFECEKYEAENVFILRKIVRKKEIINSILEFKVNKCSEQDLDTFF